MGNCCENCVKRMECRKDIGIIWGYCNTDYEPIADVLYTIDTKCNDFIVCRMKGDSCVKYYLKSTRNGNDVFYSDYIWAKGYKYETAKKHILRLLRKDIAAGINAKAIICGEEVSA